MLREGIYEARFETSVDKGEGLVVLVGGKIYGGDGMIYYVGTYAVEGDFVTARIKARPHSLSHADGYESIFGRENNTVKFEGDVSGGVVTLEGRSDQASGIAVRVRLDFLGE